MTDQTIHAFRWLGKDEPFLDEPVVSVCQRVMIGRYGGNTKATAHKNEDAALVWCADADETQPSWEFVALLDAHYSSESAELITEAIEAEQVAIFSCLAQPLAKAFTSLHDHLRGLFLTLEFREACQEVNGEASILFCARKANFLWWMNVGDVLIYLLHPELARLGQFALNQRSFFEWVGERNTFDLAVPCYATGVRELMYGLNRIVLTTDGLLEFGDRPFENPVFLYQAFRLGTQLEQNVMEALQQVHNGQGQDSATIIAWDYEA